MPLGTAFILAITALAYGFVFGRLHEQRKNAIYGARCESSVGWHYRKPEFRDWLHEDQECIEAGDFRPLQGICLAAHFAVKTPRRDIRPLKLETYKRWENNWI